MLLGFVCLPAAYAGESIADTRPGRKVEPPALKDVTGKSFDWQVLKDNKAVVVVFLSFECPVSTSYSQPLADLAKAYGERGVAFVAVSENEDLSAVQLAKHVEDCKIRIPVLRDEKHAGAEAFRAELTPEAFVLDGGLVLRYRGRIDNAYAARLKKNQQITRHDLRQALDEILAGKPVSEPITQAVGCPISRTSVARKDGDVTYHRDVLPIQQNN